MSNLSRARRQQMLDYIAQLKEIHSDDDSIIALNNIENALTEKKYGLVWEEHSEKVDEMLEDNIPVFTELEDRKIISDDEDSFNFILEGDNLHSLKLLEKTHKGKIDVIYIDPPYNRGSNDFIYNDDYVNKDDGYRHSKWLSFMNERLLVAKEALSDKGILIISIDDNEQAQIKLLCDEIFGEDNLVSILPTIMNLKGNQDQFGFAGTHEYTIVYTKNKAKAQFNEFNIDEDEINRLWEEDAIGFYKKGATLKRTGNDAPREKRPKSFYPILFKDDKIEMIEIDEYKNIYNPETKSFNDEFVEELRNKYENLGYDFILPITNSNYTSWRWSYQKLFDERDEVIVNKRNGISFYKKQRPELGDLPTRKPKSIFYKPEYSSGNGTSLLEGILGAKLFDNPKPLELIKDLIHISTDKNSVVLDFFAGSGTTGHAVVELNKEDGGNRKYILCTNNENNICEEVTYQRLKNIQEDLPHNLKYYKTDFIPKLTKDEEILSERLLLHIKEMVELEFMCEIDGKSRIIILTQDELDSWFNSVIREKAVIYLPSYIMLSREIENEAERKKVEFVDIPDYYFLEELREVNEL